MLLILWNGADIAIEMSGWQIWRNKGMRFEFKNNWKDAVRSKQVQRANVVFFIFIGRRDIWTILVHCSSRHGNFLPGKKFKCEDIVSTVRQRTSRKSPRNDWLNDHETISWCKLYKRQPAVLIRLLSTQDSTQYIFRLLQKLEDNSHASLITLTPSY